MLGSSCYKLKMFKLSLLRGRGFAQRCSGDIFIHSFEVSFHLPCLCLLICFIPLKNFLVQILKGKGLEIEYLGNTTHVFLA